MSPQLDIERLRSIKTLASLIPYLRDELAWPIERDMVEDDLTFEYQPEELGLGPEYKDLVREIKQLRPLLDGRQPWGIFWVSFEKKRLPVFMLRRILRHLVIKKRASANKSTQRAWHANDLLFISAYGEDSDRAITFAHFAQEEEGPGDLPVLKVLGWDGGDTVLHLADADRTLRGKLRWPDDPDDIPAWRDQWGRVFTLEHREVISTTQDLVEELARLAISVRKRAEAILAHESDRGPLRRLYAAFKTTLIHDLSEDDFADVIAQTISYGLLAARFSKAERVSVHNLARLLPPTNPFLRDLVELLLVAAGRKKGAFDFDELGIQDVVRLLNRANAEAVKSDFGNRTRNEDPVIHFYEYFLHAYDHAKKVERGVFFTPQPVVSYIVRSVHELLRTEFGLEDGLADTTTWGEMVKRNKDLEIPDGAKPGDPFVLILDPATGTATFLVEVIEVIFTHLRAKWTRLGKTPTQISNAWNEYVPKHLLPRLYGFELLMAPYTIAHMKLSLKLSEINTRLGQLDFGAVGDGRAHVYLTNSLEPANDAKAQGAFESFFPALAHEAAAVNQVKRDKRFTVVIGNPPYSGLSANMTEYAQRLVDVYKIVDGEPLNERKLWLQDDYVKFIRYAQMTVAHAGMGVLGYITNHGYLDNPTFRGMRQSLMATFRTLYVLDLHGNALKKERAPDGSEDKNVFEIRQGVAICVAACHSGGPRVLRGDLWGSGESKHSWLGGHSVESTAWDIVKPRTPFYFLRATEECVGAFENWPSLSELMPAYSSGVITARDELVLDYEPGPILERVALLRGTGDSDESLRRKLFKGKSSPKYPAGDSRGWKLPEARRRLRQDKNWLDRVAGCLYRPFDRRCVYLTEWMVDWSRPELRRHLAVGHNPLLVFPRNTGAGKPWNHVFASYEPILGRFFPDSACITYMAPALVFTEGMFGKASELSANFRGAQEWGLANDDEIRQRARRELGYVYAILHSATYRVQYLAQLRADFPRVPLTMNEELFLSLAGLGADLMALHLMEAPELERLITTYTGPRRPEVDHVAWAQDTVWLDAAETKAGKTDASGSVGFHGVPEPVWHFQIGGYQVCEKWLKDRKGRKLSAADIAHYQKIVVALSETIRLMKEIDQVIETHGGWPGAFAVGNAEGRAAEPQEMLVAEPGVRKKRPRGEG